MDLYDYWFFFSTQFSGVYSLVFLLEIIILKDLNLDVEIAKNTGFIDHSKRELLQEDNRSSAAG